MVFLLDCPVSILLWAGGLKSPHGQTDFVRYFQFGSPIKVAHARTQPPSCMNYDATLGRVASHAYAMARGLWLSYIDGETFRGLRRV